MVPSTCLLFIFSGLCCCYLLVCLSDPESSYRPRLALSLEQFSYLGLSSAGIMGIDHEVQLSLLLSWHTYLFSLSLISPFTPLMVIFLFSCHAYIYKIYKYVLHRKEYVRYLSFWVWLISLNLHGGSVPCGWCSCKHGVLWDIDLEAFGCYIPRCGLPGPPGRSPFRLLRKIHADFQISSSLYSQQEGWFLSPSSWPMLVIFSQWWTSDQGIRNLKELSTCISLRAENIKHLFQVIVGHLYFFPLRSIHLISPFIAQTFGILMENPFVPHLSVQTWSCCSFREIIHFPHTLTFINTTSHLFLEQNMNGFPLTFLYPTLTSKLIWVSFNFEKKKSYELNQLSLAFYQIASFFRQLLWSWAELASCSPSLSTYGVHHAVS